MHRSPGTVEMPQFMPPGTEDPISTVAARMQKHSPQPGVVQFCGVCYKLVSGAGIKTHQPHPRPGVRLCIVYKVHDPRLPTSLTV